MPKKLMIIAGEASGDFHSASLIYALKNIQPDLEICGIGGQRMRQAGAQIYFDIAELSIIGFTDVLKNFAKLKWIFHQLLNKIDEQRPDVCVLVDYPGFNLKLAEALKKRSIPVIYYISPQIWAWWKGRIKNIKRYVDKMIVLFKFEESLYKQCGLNVSFVGHPLLDIARPQFSADDFLNKLGLSSQKPVIGLAPGSRLTEVGRILPILLASAKIIKSALPQAQFVLLKAPQLAPELFSAKIKQFEFPLALCENQTYDFLNICELVLVASGTATLETAIMQKPMIVMYKVSFLNWLIARMLIRVAFIGLVNVVAGKMIVPEFIQYQAHPRLIAQAALKMLNNPALLTKVKADLQKVRESLGELGASQRAAQIILSHIN